MGEIPQVYRQWTIEDPKTDYCSIFETDGVP